MRISDIMPFKKIKVKYKSKKSLRLSKRSDLLLVRVNQNRKGKLFRCCVAKLIVLKLNELETHNDEILAC